MKLVAVALLFPGMLCNSVLAMAEGPVPFSAYVQAAGAQSTAPPPPNAKDQFTPVSNPPAHTHMTSGGKIMTGAGIGMLVVGGAVIVGAAMFSASGSWLEPTNPEKAAAFGAGAGLCAGGVTLIIFGHHRRSAE